MSKMGHQKQTQRQGQACECGCGEWVDHPATFILTYQKVTGYIDGEPQGPWKQRSVHGFYALSSHVSH